MEWKELLPRLRKERGLSQAELAEKLEISRQAVSRWETGQSTPSADNLIALSKVYGMTVEELYTHFDPAGTEETDPEPPAERETAKAGIPGTGRSRKKRIAAGIVVCICGGILLWGKLTNSMAVTKTFFASVAVLAFWGLLAYAALIIIIKFGRNIKK